MIFEFVDQVRQAAASQSALACLPSGEAIELYLSHLLVAAAKQDLRQFLDQIMKEGRELSSSEIQSYSFQVR
jgi:hypothetical protein